MIAIKKKRFVVIIVCIIIGSMLLGGLGAFGFMHLSGHTVVNSKKLDQYKNIANRYGKLYYYQEVINSKFLWEVDEEKQMEAIYHAMADSLDDKYSSYMSSEEFEAFVNYVNGTFQGVGIVFTTDPEGKYVITQLVKDGPAQAAGFKVGDQLTKVDGKTYDDSTKMAEAMRGESGTEVKITRLRDGKEKTVSVIRAEVEAPSVYTDVIDKDYAVITITAFEETTGQQFKDEVEKLEKDGIKGFVLDMRGNPGGLVDQGVIVADELLPECTIAHTEDKNGETQYYNSDADCTKLKYVLLVNENTASAAEIVTAAVKENKGGKIVGKKTYGKGIIQGTVTYEDGSALKLTTMQYFSPKGNKIHKVGIEPDVKASLPKDAISDVQMEKALKVLK